MKGLHNINSNTTLILKFDPSWDGKKNDFFVCLI